MTGGLEGKRIVITGSRKIGELSEVRYFYDYIKVSGGYLDVNKSFKKRVLAVAVGKVTAEALKEEGVQRVLAPENERMGAMIVELTHYYRNKSTLRGMSE